MGECPKSRTWMELRSPAGDRRSCPGPCADPDGEDRVGAHYRLARVLIRHLPAGRPAPGVGRTGVGPRCYSAERPAGWRRGGPQVGVTPFDRVQEDQTYPQRVPCVLGSRVRAIETAGRPPGENKQ